MNIMQKCRFSIQNTSLSVGNQKCYKKEEWLIIKYISPPFHLQITTLFLFSLCLRPRAKSQPPTHFQIPY
uniref:Uncharacterized protein n=1 Tax=Helianthus annuus TaxID=4232 RepID=A0A251TJD7_HELAN